MRLKIVALALPLALFSGTAYGAPTQMDPRSEPVTTGPLINSNSTYAGGENPRCGLKATKTSEGETAGITKLCFSFYRFDPSQETDGARDYGVWWIQATLTPKNGWCAKKFKGTLTLSADGQYHAATKRDFKAGRSKTVTQNLKVDVEGFATTPASLKKAFVARPSVTAGGFSAKNNRLNLVWRGATEKKVAVVGGVEGSWDAATGNPGFFGAGALPTLTDGC